MSAPDRRNPKKSIFLFLLPIGILIFIISGYTPNMTEKVYSRFIYKILGQTISSFFGLIPLSMAELIIGFSAVFALGYMIKTAYYLVTHPNREKIFKKFIVDIFCIVGLVYFCFVILWGINYNRLSFEEMLNLNTKSPTQEELVRLCYDLATRANSLRDGLNENSDGVMMLPYERTQALEIAYKGFEKASSSYPILDGKYGRPKGIMLSELMCYTGITGFIFPFTGEANINTKTPEPFFPSTVTHEMAHQRGIAREDEANFIAYVTCIHHPDTYFQYSGTLLALSYSMSALRKANTSEYKEFISGLSPGVVRDLNFNSEFWNRYSGPVEEASSKINDTYLKANKQKAGIKSYGAMVDLLIAEYRKNNITQQ